jgi:hypothetical protein
MYATDADKGACFGMGLSVFTLRTGLRKSTPRSGGITRDLSHLMRMHRWKAPLKLLKDAQVEVSYLS